MAYPLTGRGERFPFVAEAAEAFWPAGMADGDDTARFSAILHGVAWTERLAFDLVDSAGYDITGDGPADRGRRPQPGLEPAARRRPRACGVPARAQRRGRRDGRARGRRVRRCGRGCRIGGEGSDPLAEAAARLVPEPTRIEPDLDRHDRLMEAYGRFLDALAERGWVGRSLLAAGRERAAR